MSSKYDTGASTAGGTRGPDSSPPSAKRMKAGSDVTQLREGQAEQAPKIDPDRHDVLVVDEFENLYRFELNENKQGFSKALFVKPFVEGERKVLEVAGPRNRRRRRPDQAVSGFALLPIREEPVSTFFCCYLVHSPFFGGALEQVTLHRDSESTFAFELPKARGARGLAVKASLPQRTALEVQGAPKEGAPGADVPRVALRIESDGGKYAVDAELLDFVNPWTLANWSAAYNGKPPPKAPLGRDPWGLLVKREDQCWIVTDGRGQDSGAAKREIPKSGIFGLLSRDLAFLDLDRVACAKACSVLLVALPDGNVRRFALPLRQDGSVGTKVPLRQNPAIWRLLRNGCVLGDVQVTSEHGRERGVLFNLSSLKGSREADVEAVTGTLDFKWAHPKLTVRFVSPKGAIPGATEARQLIQSTFENWLADSGLEVNVLLNERDDLPADVKDSNAEREEKPYDILISLDTLGTVDQTQSQKLRDVNLPTSELGAYALRRSYGSPTLWLGEPPGIKLKNGAKSYFESDEFKHFVVHEVGHALGLPHLHQAPQVDEIQQLTLKEPEEIIKEVQAKYGLTLTTKFLDEEVLRTWAKRENDEFSVWPDLRGKIPKSVMFGLPGVSIFKELEAPELVDAPTEFDKAWLKQLYPEEPVSQVSETTSKA